MNMIGRMCDLIRELAESGALPRGLLNSTFDGNSTIEELGIDSVGAVELLYAIEDKLGIYITYDLLTPDMRLEALAKLAEQPVQPAAA